MLTWFIVHLRRGVADAPVSDAPTIPLRHFR
jgi:hypothetical protein